VKRALVLLLAAVATPALAHLPGETPVRPDGIAVVACLIATAVLLYGLGLTRLWLHTHEHAVLTWRALAFGAGCAMLVTLLLGPLDAAAPRSFALHMLQHEGLMLIAAPLLVLGKPLPLFLWALPHDLRLVSARVLQSGGLKASWHWLTAPLAAWIAHALALWLWHAPSLFNAALRDPVLHEWQHVTFLLTALLFWHAVLRHGAHGARGVALLYLFTTTVHTGVLGALLTFARRPLYASMEQGLTPWLGLTALEDQQLGGLIMWVPGALVYVGAGLWLLSRWVGAEHSLAR
jgi:putative membrane protein